MTTKRIEALKGYHFMVREADNDFYFMKISAQGYSPHTSGEYSSALYVNIEYAPKPTSDVPPSEASRTSPNATTTITSSRTTANTNVNYSGGSSSGSSGGY
tara:strand:+ start:99 stop:401 length:303 start_codon:yes stop_codon:yes gene_type:complete